MTLNLPEPLEEYFAAANAYDGDRVAACFAENGVVHDEARDHIGRDAIRTWAEEAGRKYRFHAEVLTIEEAGGETVVTVHLTGDFPGNPIDLPFRFKLASGQIAELEIG